jgi:hypothetical protein
MTSPATTISDSLVDNPVLGLMDFPALNLLWNVYHWRRRQPRPAAGGPAVCVDPSLCAVLYRGLAETLRGKDMAQAAKPFDPQAIRVNLQPILCMRGDEPSTGTWSLSLKSGRGVDRGHGGGVAALSGLRHRTAAGTLGNQRPP